MDVMQTKFDLIQSEFGVIQTCIYIYIMLKLNETTNDVMQTESDFI